MRVDLVVVQLRADFDRVISHHLGKIIAEFEVVVNLVKPVGIGTDGEVIEEDILYALGLRRQRDNAQRSRSGHKALRGKADAQPACRLAQIVCVARVTEAKFIDGARSQRLGIAENGQLRAARIQTR